MKFIANKPAAVIGKTLVICDLHYGIELFLQRNGVQITLEPHKYADALNKLQRESKTTELLVVGDFKHTITGFDQRERNYFNELIHLLKFKKITIVKGNHDGNIEQLAKPFPQIEIQPPTGYSFKNGKVTYGFFHGHALPSEKVLACHYIFCGHNHAGVRIGSEKFGKTTPAWLVVPFNTKQKLIAMPSFNPLSGNVAFNAVKRSSLHGPIFKDKRLDLENAEVIQLNGQRIGKLKHLRTV
ncbi:MAG: metallophosphoesterase [Candidatus Micrarchaeota archaeon]